MIGARHLSALGAALGAAVLTALVLVAVAHAGASSLSWQQAAGQLSTPVYRPTVTLGIKPQTLVINKGGCLIGAWGATRTQKGPHFSVDEPGVTSQCGQPGETDQVSKTTINGKKVPIEVQCKHLPHCTVHDGETDGVFIMFVPERAGAHYVIQLDSAHVSLHNLIRVARSFVRVIPPPTSA